MGWAGLWHGIIRQETPALLTGPHRAAQGRTKWRGYPQLFAQVFTRNDLRLLLLVR